jgi:hypothetical protein
MNPRIILSIRRPSRLEVFGGARVALPWVVSSPSPLYAASKYTYRLLWSAEKRRFVGVCSEFADLRYEATAASVALDGIQRRVADELETLMREGKPHPEPLVVRKFGKFGQ